MLRRSNSHRGSFARGSLITSNALIVCALPNCMLSGPVVARNSQKSGFVLIRASIRPFGGGSERLPFIWCRNCDNVKYMRRRTRLWLPSGRCSAMLCQGLSESRLKSPFARGNQSSDAGCAAWPPTRAVKARRGHAVLLTRLRIEAQRAFEPRHEARLANRQIGITRVELNPAGSQASHRREQAVALTRSIIQLGSLPSNPARFNRPFREETAMPGARSCRCLTTRAVTHFR